MSSPEINLSNNADKIPPSNLWPYLIDNQNIVMPGSPEFQPWFESLSIRDKWVVMGALELAAVNSNLIAIYQKAAVNSKEEPKIEKKSINSDQNTDVSKQTTTVKPEMAAQNSQVSTVSTTNSCKCSMITSSSVGRVSSPSLPSSAIDHNHETVSKILNQVSFEQILNDMIIKKVFSCWDRMNFDVAIEKLVSDPDRPVLVRSKCSLKLQKRMDRLDSIVRTYSHKESAILVRKLQYDHLNELCYQLKSDAALFESHLPEKLQETAFLVDNMSANEIYDQRDDCEHVELQFLKMFMVGGLLMLAEKAYHVRDKIRQNY